MTGSGARDESDDDTFDRELSDIEKDDLVRLEREMSPLLGVVSTFAREEETEIGTYAANTSYAVSDVARESAVLKILALQARERAHAPAVSNANSSPARSVIPLVRSVPRQRRVGRSLLVAAGGLGAAALALCLWMHPMVQDPSLSLPAYSIAARGGIKDARGGAAAGADEARTTTSAQRLNAESQLVVAARPDTAVTGAVAARAFVVQGASVTEVAPNAQVAPTGAIELRFQGGDLIGSRHGAASLRVIVGRPDALRELPAQTSMDPSSKADAPWRTLTVPLELGSP
jgi:hypothetical protein